MGTIRISRVAGQYADKLRAYRVVIDGTTVGKIKAGEEQSFEVDPGQHVVQLRVDWARSRKLEVDVVDAGEVELQCQARQALDATLHSFVLLGANYMYLRPADQVTTR